MFMPSILIKYLKVKWTLVVCIFCYSTYMAAQFYPEFYTLIPTAFILGMGAAPSWAGKPLPQTCAHWAMPHVIVMRMIAGGEKGYTGTAAKTGLQDFRLGSEGRRRLRFR